MIRFSPSLVILALIILSLFITTATACTKCTKKKRCPKGAYCRTGKCIYYARPGARCNPRKCVVCAKGAVCRQGRCVAKSSSGTESKSQPSETNSGMQCGVKCMADRDCKAKGYLCYGGSCVTFVGEKKSCGGCVRCQRGMSCDKGGHCRKIERFVKQCEGCSKDQDCQNGLFCKKLPNGNRRCAKPNGLGGQCDGPCFGCQSRLVCIRGKCVVPPKKQGRCGECDHPLGCMTGLNCQMYAPGKGRCVTQLGLGEDCTDVCDDCGAYMTCRRDGKCGPHGKDKCEVCEKDVDCADGLVCKKGASGYGRCAATMPKGKDCADACSACAEGLVCRDGQVCDVPKGSKCDRCRKDADCTNGLVCKLGDGEAGRCATPMILGAKCSDPCWACHPGLVCSKDQVCVEPKANWCEQCAVDGDCIAGLVCKTNEFGEGKCARPMSAGQKCSDPCWGCKHGLQCKSVDGSEICVKLKEDVCGPCARDGDCRQGLVCKKDTTGKGKCAKVMPIGASCADPCWACDRGLVCVGGKLCSTPKEKLCGPCDQTSDCADGLTCKKDVSGLGRCAKPMDVGSKCDHSCWACKDGSICGNDYVCREMPQQSYSQRPSIRPRTWPRMSKSPKPSKSPAYSRYSWPDWYYRSPSESPTPSTSNTPSRSPTLSLSNSPSKSPAPSMSNTPSGSPTPSMSTTPSTSPTPSLSITPSTSSTASRSPTPSMSNSPSISPTPSMSNSPSASSIPSMSSTPSNSPSMSSTPSSSPTPSVSVTPSKSATPSASITPSRSAKPSMSSTPSRSPTPSISSTPSKSAKPSVSATPSESPTPSNSPTSSSSPKPSKSSTPSSSPTPSKSPSPSKSAQSSKSPSPSASPTHGRYCSPCYDSLSCMGGLKCHRGKCAKMRGLGYDCRDPCHACKSGLICDKKRGKCVADRCGSCQWSVDCRDGLACHMHRNGVGKCGAWGDSGDDCSNDCLRCKEGLVCKDGKCEEPKSRKCGTCLEDVDCEGELICKREGRGKETGKCDRLGHGTCVSVTGVGGNCHGECAMCERGLICKDGDGKCGKVGKKCDPCGRDEECDKGLKCKIIGGRGKCARVMKEGQKCSDPCWACGEGLVCEEGRVCRRM